MIIKKWKYKNVTRNGVVKSGGAVKVKKGLYTSIDDSCKIISCKCYKGHWISVNLGYNNKQKSVSGRTFYFDSMKEFNDFKMQTPFKDLQTIFHQY